MEFHCSSIKRLQLASVMALLIPRISDPVVTIKDCRFPNNKPKNIERIYMEEDSLILEIDSEED